jgi:uncharacterized membrane protein
MPVRLPALPLPALASALVALALGGAPAGAEALRGIVGSLTYPERIALPETAEVVLELQDGAGFALEELRFATSGRQVPLAFELTAPAGPSLRLRAGVLAADGLLRVTDFVAIEAGRGPVDLGALRLEAHVPMGFASMLVCGAVTVELGFVGDVARLRAGDRVIDLRPEGQAAAGTWAVRLVAEGEAETWVEPRGQRAVVSLQGQRLPDCIMADALPPLPFRATGTAPVWLLELDGARMRLVRDMGALLEDGPQPLPDDATAEGEIALTAEWGRAVLRRGVCRDAVTGVPYPYAVEVAVDGSALTGCGGDPLALLRGGVWLVTAADGVVLPPGADVRLGFSDAAVSLQGSCNRAVGPLELTGTGLTMGPLAATLRECGLAGPEAALQGFLAEVTGFDIDAEGGLVLRTADGRRLHARR